ncbi:class I SAM-dependent methyltransferase [Paeniglutamicibacter antarcticus]|uniref:Class I SAM-dependent methyltransferase n=1 Tax=Arthrobacter terrae TaxID=2935737 RepID=A0A931CH46_9MICC|nr:class I SAM-dependent methyltransferase [Arthrobacter terrae]MBG0738258.1 class I SAM-dependent methyltransferase [Arthrobacter terrae]
MNQTPSAPTASTHGAVLHDEVRPAWSAEVVSWLLGSPLSGQRLAVLDLGAGTGLGTRTIATLGHAVTAVDTSTNMLSVLQTSCQELPSEVANRITALTGSAEYIPLGEQSLDAIICLQAWHWVEPEQATAECDRVLKPNGMMGMAWHTWDRTNEWVQALAAIVEPNGTPTDQTLSVPEELAGRGTFERKEYPLNYELTVDQLVQLASSWSYVAKRPDRNVVLTKIRSLGEQAASPHTGLVRFPHITAAFRLKQPGQPVVG